jgi:hypothetical protein
LKEDDIDAEFVQQVQKLKPIPGYLLYASSVVDQVRNDLGTTNRELLLNIHRLFPEIATRWSALSPSEKTTWREEPKQRLEDFKKYVQDVFEKRKK